MKTVFLDLDGTLTDPKPGITGSVQYALERAGVTVPSQDELEWVIGPPLIESFARLGVPDPAQALVWYRERYTDTGLFDNRVYEGIPQALQNLRDAGLQLCLATAKPHVYARRITAHFGLSGFMAHEFGPELDGTRNDKGDLLAHALALTGVQAAQSVMVGDRLHDIRAAAAVGMDALHVQWGYGPGESAGAVASLAAPQDLAGAVLGLLDAIVGE